MKAVEGQFIVTDDDHIFEVKGVVHPKDRIIAYLRYLPSHSGEREDTDGKKYRKIYALSDREDYLRSKKPEYLWYSKSHDREFQSVRLEDIAYVLDPIDTLNKLYDSGRHLDELQRTTIELVESLLEFSGVDSTTIGVTGSQLASLHTSRSDIDLVVYSKQSARKLYASLPSCYETDTRFQKYTREQIRSHVEFRWPALSKFRAYLTDIEMKKYLQGRFSNFEYFIRLVKLPEGLDYDFYSHRHRLVGYGQFVCKVLDSQDSIFTPCEYSVECENNEIEKITSYRGRFTEHSESGDLVVARGRIEEVIDTKDSTRFQQLVLGEQTSDFMIPASAIDLT